MSEPKCPLRTEESLAKKIAALKVKAGHSIEEWQELIKKTDRQGHKQIVTGLKTEKGFWKLQRPHPSPCESWKCE